MKLVFPRLYAIITADLVKTSVLSLAERLAESGVELIQYRHKLASPRRLFETTRKLAEVARPRGVRVIVNDRADIAALAGAGGVHVGQEDLGVEEARLICGTGCWVGVSTHSLEQVRAMAETSADYVAVGPVFETSTKQQPDPVVGLELLRRARAITPKPLVAIGGITLERAEAVFTAGADCLAVASDLLNAPEPAARAGEYLAVAARLAEARN